MILVIAARGILVILIGITDNQIIFKATDFYIPTVGYAIAIVFGFFRLEKLSN